MEPILKGVSIMEEFWCVRDRNENDLFFFQTDPIRIPPNSISLFTTITSSLLNIRLNHLI